MFQHLLRYCASTLVLCIARKGGTDVVPWMLDLVSNSQQLPFLVLANLYQHLYWFLPYTYLHYFLGKFFRRHKSSGKIGTSWLLEHMAVPEYIVPNSPPLEGMCNWNLHMTPVARVSSQLALGDEVHLFTIFFLIYFMLR